MNTSPINPLQRQLQLNLRSVKPLRTTSFDETLEQARALARATQDLSMSSRLTPNNKLPGPVQPSSDDGKLYA